MREPLRWRRLPLYILAAPFVAFAWGLGKIYDAADEIMDRLS